MPSSSKCVETPTAAGGIPGTWVNGETIDAIFNAGKRGTRADLLFAATRELTNLLGDRGSCILLKDGPRIAVALSEPAAAGRSVELGHHPEIEEAIRAGGLVATEDGSSIAVPLVTEGECHGVIAIQCDHPRPISDGAKATAALAARVTASLLATAPERPAAAPITSALRRNTPTAIPTLRPGGYGRRILIVEDDGNIAASVAHVLEDEGYVVQHARDGRDGVAWAVSTRPDLILLDVNLPSLDGLAGAVQLRQSPITADIPIIFLSARRDLSTRVRLSQLDHVDFMAKPFSGEELLARIDQAFVAGAARLALAHRAAIDELTGLANLRVFRTRLADEHQRVARYGGPMSVVMLDVDKLKAINDELGHAAGSDALRAIADVLRRQVRASDLAARYGGDEMVLLLPQTTVAQASAFAERVRSEVARLDVRGCRLTVSVGIASVSGRPGSIETDMQLLERADAAAYAAKRQGGDRICVAPEPPPAG